MKKEWNVTDSAGNVHKVQCNLGGFGGNKVIVDNDTYKLKSSNWFINVVDYQINLPGASCNLVIIGNNIRLSVNGVFLDDGKPYEPVSNVPVWEWVLVGISFVGGFFFNGVVGICISTLFTVFAVKSSLEKKTALAVVLPIVSLVVTFALGMFFASLLQY